MAYIWQTVDFLTGATGPDRVLPHVPGTGQYSHDIKAAISASINVHKDLLGANGAWRNKMKRIDDMIICHDDSKAWNDPDAILTGGPINAIPSEFGQTVNVTVSGVPEWLRMRAVCEVFNGTITDPNATYIFQGSTGQNTLHSLIKSAFSDANIPAGQRTPPRILRNVDGTQTTAPALISKEEDQEFPEHTIEVNPATFKTYWGTIEEARDVTSNNGNEVMPKLIFLNPEKTLIGLDFKIGSDSQPHLNFDQTKTIYLERDGDVKGYIDGSKDYHVISVNLNQNGENYANRVIAQSTAGGPDGEPADFQTKMIAGGPSVLVDTFYNPNVQRDPAFFTQEINTKLADSSRYPLTGTITLIGDPAEWNNHVGKKLFIIEETDDSGDPMNGFGKNEELRISDIKVTPSENGHEAKIVVGFVTPKARYPRLPREFKKDDPYNTNINKNATTNPVVIGRPKNAPNLYDPTVGNTGIPDNNGGNNWGDKGVPDTAETYRLASGSTFSLAIAGDGSLYSWGDNYYGQLGLGEFPKANTSSNGTNDKRTYTTPQKIGSSTDWAAVYTLGSIAYAIKKDGTLYSWGYDNTGRGMHKNSPTQIMTGVKRLYVGSIGAYAHKADGSIVDQFGNDIVNGKKDLVKLQTNDDSDTYFAALDTEGRLWEWGLNGDYANSQPANRFPELRFKDIYVARWVAGGVGYSYYGAGIELNTNQLYTWGKGYHGTPDVFWRTKPAPFAMDVGTIHSFPQWKHIISRPYSTLMWIDNTGKLMAIGEGHAWSIINNWSTPIDYGKNTNFDWRKEHFISAGNNNFLAIINGGQLWVGGWNYSGELGIGQVGRRSDALFQAGTVNKWRTVDTAYQSGGYVSSIAILGSDMFGTGQNDSGQLGLGKQNFLGIVYYDNLNQQYNWTIQPTSKDPEQ